MSRFATIVLTLAVALTARAQIDFTPPSAEHLKKLEPLMGAVWTATNDTPIGSITEEYSYEWVTNRAFVMFTHSMTIQGDTHTEYGMFAWDPEIQKIRFWGFIADGSYFSGHEVDTEPGELIAFDVDFTGSRMARSARISMSEPRNNTLDYTMTLDRGGGHQQTITASFKRKGAPEQPEHDPRRTEYTFEIREIESVSALTARAHTTGDQLTETFTELFGEIMQYMGRLGLEQAGPPFAVYHSFDERGDEIDVQAGIPIDRRIVGRGRVVFTELPAVRAAVATHKGPYDRLSEAHNAMKQWLDEHDHEQSAPPREIYLTDPGAVPDPADWETLIIYPID